MSSVPPGVISEELLELEAVLGSRLFTRSPNLSSILQYTCRNYLEGRAGEIKEYTIAVYALGRDPSFTPARDSIVRVEASRLRKRLKEYYAGEGASHKVQIELPESGYVPRFVRTAASVSPAIEAVTPSVRSEAPSSGGNKNRFKSAWIKALPIAALVVCLGAVAVYQSSRRLHRTPAPPPASLNRPSPMPAAETSLPVRISVGSVMPKYEDSLGRTWSNDQYVTGGEVISRPDHRIYRTLDAALYQNARVGDFEYKIPLKPGTYELHLYFAEILHSDTVDSSAEGYRRFNASLNGKALLSEFDITLDSGGMVNTADEKVFTNVSPASDGLLHLHFWASNDQALLSGIEILPAEANNKMRPVRILTGGRTAYDSTEQFWSADRYFLGGRVMSRTKPVKGSPNPELYVSERFGNFNYAIPVASGSYSATLCFAESNFGVDNFGASHYRTIGKGNREFDILCNGQALLRNFDISAEAGGPNVAVTKTSRKLKPNAQGKLIFSFVPVIDYAALRAIQIVPE